MAEPLRLALVGFGAIAASYVAALRGQPALRPVAVVDPDAAARARATAALDVPAFADLETLLGAVPRPDAALVAAPPAHHEPLTVRLLGNGLHVLCEKPFAVSVAEARRMLAAARTADRRLVLCSKFRYVAGVQRARQLVAEGAVGDVVRYENAFCSHVDMTQRWNGRRAVAGGGVLIDNGSHAFDLARCLLGPLARVTAVFGANAQALEVEDTAHVSFVAVAGAIGSVDLSWSLHKGIDDYVRITGTRGVIELGWRHSRYRRHGAAWHDLGGGYDKQAAFGAQLADFAGAIGTGTPARIGDADALAAVTAVECAYRAAAEGRWVDLPADASLP